MQKVTGVALNLCHARVSHPRPCRVQAHEVLGSVFESGLVPVAVPALAVIAALAVVAAVDVQVVSAWDDPAFDSPASTASAAAAAVVVSAAALAVAVEALS